MNLCDFCKERPRIDTMRNIFKVDDRVNVCSNCADIINSEHYKYWSSARGLPYKVLEIKLEEFKDWLKHWCPIRDAKIDSKGLEIK